VTAKRAGLYVRQSHGSRKSQDDQRLDAVEQCEDMGLTLVRETSDGTSASRYARKVRENWPTVMAWITGREIDVLILWEVSRGDRKAAAWLQVLDVCAEHGVQILVLKAARIYNPADGGQDWEFLATEGVKAQSESDQIRKRTTRGLHRSAASGKPHSHCPVGYIRQYDPQTREFLGQIPCPITAPVIKEIIKRLAAREPVRAIARDIASRPGIGQLRSWDRKLITYIARNLAYSGIREYVDRHGKPQQTKAVWPALVDPVQQREAIAYLAPRSRCTKPTLRRHRLSGLLRCSVCGIGLQTSSDKGRRYYTCPAGHLRIFMVEVDEYVMKHAAAAIAEAAIAPATDDSELRAAEADAAMAEKELNELKQAARTGKLTLEMAMEMEPVRRQRLDVAQRRVTELSRPAGNRALGDVDYADADAVYARLASLPAHVCYDIVAELLSITVRPLERGEGYGWRPARVNVSAAIM
jgi:DNA invertase Pin-like site-specific DNA recombinase